jgi:adenylosuccinate lyase
MSKARIIGLGLITTVFFAQSSWSVAQTSENSAPGFDRPDSIASIFLPDNRNQRILDIEAAIAKAQAVHGVIPMSAADHIAEKADVKYIPLAALAAEYKKTNHRMVALLNVWSESLDTEAANYLHYGVTTVDIYSTVTVLQVKDSILLLIEDMREIERALLDLAEAQRDTVMIGRTIGQHALPITFGKKVSVWAAQNRRNIDRLKEVLARVETRGVLKGAVGTHLGLGPKGRLIERDVSGVLGLSDPEPADWQGSRDVFAEYGQVLALISKSYGAIGAETFRLMGTDIGELSERQPDTNIGSSTMPHKQNPRMPERLIAHSRKIPRLAEILLDDVENSFERDNTSGPNRIVEEISLEADRMMRDTLKMIEVIVVNDSRMLENVNQTDGMVMAQRLVLFLSPTIPKSEAEDHIRRAAQLSIARDISFREALLQDPVISPHLEAHLDELLDPKGYLGLSAQQVDETVQFIMDRRKTDP